MTPIVLIYAGLPEVRAFYAPSDGPLAQLLVTNVLDLTAVEFAFRGFLMLTLIRVIGPFAWSLPPCRSCSRTSASQSSSSSRRSAAG